MAQQLLRSLSLILAISASPLGALAQGAPSNAAESSGAFAGVRSPRLEGAAPRAWSASLRVFADYDSNVGLTEDNPPPPFQAEAAFRTGLSGAGRWRVVGDDALEAGVGGYFTQTGTFGDSFADEYDLGTLAPQLWANARFALGERPAFAQLAYQFRRDWLEGDDFERSHSVRLRSGVRVRDDLELEASYAIHFDDFDATGFHALDARRDADHQRVSLAATWLRTEAGQAVTFGYQYSRNAAERDDFDFRGHGVTARFRTPFVLGTLLDLQADYTHADYTHFTTSPRREARTQRYRARVLVPLTSHLAADVGVGFLRVGADQARFRAKRHDVSLGLSYFF